MDLELAKALKTLQRADRPLGFLTDLDNTTLLDLGAKVMEQFLRNLKIEPKLIKLGPNDVLDLNCIVKEGLLPKEKVDNFKAYTLNLGLTGGYVTSSLDISLEEAIKNYQICLMQGFRNIEQLMFKISAFNNDSEEYTTHDLWHTQWRDINNPTRYLPKHERPKETDQLFYFVLQQQPMQTIFNNIDVPEGSSAWGPANYYNWTTQIVCLKEKTPKDLEKESNKKDVQAKKAAQKAEREKKKLEELMKKYPEVRTPS